MAKEIERKFLVKEELFQPQGAGSRVRQGYLPGDGELLVRIRQKDDRAFLTLKGRNTGITRAEYEYEIPAADAAELFAFCRRPLIEKTRWHETVDGKLWEIDRFFGDNEGLLLAEIELADEAEKFTRPCWLGREVSGDPRYYNSNLAKNPFSVWGKGEKP